MPQMAAMNRRAFLASGAALLAAPLAAEAQQAGKVYRIGFLGATSASQYKPYVEAMRQGLSDHGYVEGRNLTIEYRWADGSYQRLGPLAVELVRLKVDVIVTHGAPGTQAAKQATTTIPIVMAVVGNPEEVGLVQSLARPGGNITGSSFMFADVNAKRVEMLKHAVPGLRRVAVLLNPDNVAHVSVLTGCPLAAASAAPGSGASGGRLRSRLWEYQAAGRRHRGHRRRPPHRKRGPSGELGRPAAASDHRFQGVGRRRWVDGLRDRLPRCLAAVDGPGRPDLQGCQRGRTADPASNEV